MRVCSLFRNREKNMGEVNKKFTRGTSRTRKPEEYGQQQGKVSPIYLHRRMGLLMRVIDYLQSNLMQMYGVSVHYFGTAPQSSVFHSQAMMQILFKVLGGIGTITTALVFLECPYIADKVR